MDALKLEWSFGLNRTMGVLNLCDGQRHAVFYAAAQTGILYDYGARTQRLLLGHCSPISCCVVSPDKKWVVTGDNGDDAVVVVWDADDGTPALTIYTKAVSLDVSSDGAFLSLLSDEEIAVWDWGNTDAPRHAAKCVGHSFVRFNPGDVGQLVTNNADKLLFWSWDGGALACYAPHLSRRNFRQKHFGKFTVSCFLPTTSQAVTATDDGVLVVWDSIDGEKAAVKIVQLCEAAIRQVVTTGPFLVVGGDDGAVRVYDFLFRLEAWFEDVCAGDITSISFAAAAALSNDSKQQLPDMIVGTKDACVVSIDAALFDEVRPEDRRGTVLVQGTSGDTTCAVHPTEPLLVIASASGSLYLWEYETKVLRSARVFEAARPLVVAMDPGGLFLAVGFAGGLIRLLDPTTLEDLQHHSLKTHDDVTFLEFAPDNEWLAAATASNAVYIWKRTMAVLRGPAAHAALARAADAPTVDPDTGIVSVHVPTWVSIGRCIAHSKAVTGLAFGGDPTSLVSAGEDKNLVEYDLAASSVDAGVVVKTAVQVEEEALFVPTAVAWHPLSDGDFERRIITANSDFKFKEWNADNKLCRKTSLGPTFGGPVNSFVPLSNSLAAYATRSRVLGLVKLPLTGNPDNLMGLIGHPGAVNKLVPSPCGRYLFSAGGTDPTVNMWRLNPSALDKVDHDDGVQPYLSLLPNDYDELVDYFYYLQLRRQGEDATDHGDRDGTVRLADIPALVRALGHYPSETDVAHIVAEVKYSAFSTTGTLVDRIGLDDFLKLYVNHRPTAALELHHIHDALATISTHLDTTNLTWDNIATLLTTRGDKMSKDDLAMCIEALNAAEHTHPTAPVSPHSLVHNILGFEEQVPPDDLPLSPHPETTIMSS